MAPGSAELIIARGFQGAGAAAVFASNVALINDVYSGRDRGVAFGVWGGVNGAAAAAGPIIGGLLTEGLSWRWIFFVNLPISVAAVAMALRTLPRGGLRADVPIDVPGVVAFTTAAATATYALTRVPEVGWTAGSTIALLIVAAVALAAFILIEARSRYPAIDLPLLRRPAFAGVLFAGCVMSVAAFAYATYLSLWMQSIRGMSPIDAGLTLIPFSIASFVSALVVGRVLYRLPPRLPIAAGLAFIGAGALLQAHLDADSTWSSLTVGLVVAGFGVGLASPGLASAALGAVPVERGGMASGALNTSRQLGYAVGIAMLGVICQARIADVLRSSGVADADAVGRHVLGGQRHAILEQAPSERRGSVDEAIHAAFASGLNRALVVAGLIGIAGAIVVALTVRTPGQTDPPVTPPESEREPVPA